MCMTIYLHFPQQLRLSCPKLRAHPTPVCLHSHWSKQRSWHSLFAVDKLCISPVKRFTSVFLSKHLYCNLLKAVFVFSSFDVDNNFQCTVPILSSKRCQFVINVESVPHSTSRSSCMVSLLSHSLQDTCTFAHWRSTSRKVRQPVLKRQLVLAHTPLTTDSKSFAPSCKCSFLFVPTLPPLSILCLLRCDSLCVGTKREKLWHTFMIHPYSPLTIMTRSCPQHRRRHTNTHTHTLTHMGGVTLQ